jgi:hypothetical protein
MVFMRYQNLLKRLVAASLRIPLESITEFSITNQEIPPSFANEKYCRLDIRMVVDGQRVVLEVQVRNEKDFPERSLYYWARDFSSALPKRGEYAKLPRVIVINIVAFRLFKCKEFYSEFQPLEIARHTPLTDRMRLMGTSKNPIRASCRRIFRAASSGATCIRPCYYAASRLPRIAKNSLANPHKAGFRRLPKRLSARKG